MPFLYIVILGLYSSLAFAQSIIPSSQPTCVQQCQPFIQAQQACAPDKGQQALYQSCFCQSGYLIGIKTNAANNICPDCPTADWNIIAGWYEGLCGGSAAVPPPAAGAGNGQNPPTGPPAATTTSTTSEDSSATTAGDAYLTSANNPANWTDASSW